MEFNITKIKAKKIQKKQKQEQNKNDDCIANQTRSKIKESQCTICYEQIINQGILDSCSHLFCYDCITYWTKTQNKCPVCKRTFSKIQEKKKVYYGEKNNKQLKDYQKTPRDLVVQDRQGQESLFINVTSLDLRAEFSLLVSHVLQQFRNRQQPVREPLQQEQNITPNQQSPPLQRQLYSLYGNNNAQLIIQLSEVQNQNQQ